MERTVSMESVQGQQAQSNLNVKTKEDLNVITKKDLEDIVFKLEQIITKPLGLNFAEIGFDGSNPNREDVVKTIKNIGDFSKKIINLLASLETYLDRMEEEEKKEKAKMDKAGMGEVPKKEPVEMEDTEMGDAEKVEEKVEEKKAQLKRKRSEESYRDDGGDRKVKKKEEDEELSDANEENDKYGQSN